MNTILQHAVLDLICIHLLMVSAHAATIPLWARWEEVFQAGSSATPEVELIVELTSPSGKVSRITGFWDGGTTWRARFMPDETGKWHYRTRTAPAIGGLNGKTGEFVCSRESGNTRFLQHGALRVSPNGRYFVHADGTPFLWVGDTCWYGPILSAKEDWNTYLEDRVRKRFDVVHFNVVAPRNGVAADENGEISFSGEKHIRVNPRFYQRLDARIDAMNSHGLLAAIVLTWGLRPVDSGNSLPEEEVVRLIRYLESRYGANHVVWIVTGDNYYEGPAGERWRRIGRAAFDGRKHAPVTTHPAGMHWPWESFRDEQWLDFIIYQSGHGDDAKTLQWIHSGPPSQHWQDPPPRPFINIEPPYEGHLGYHSRKPHSDYATRRAIYWSLLNAPTAGVTYGVHGVWSWHTAVGQPPTDHPDTGVAKTWRESLPFPGSTQMKYLEGFFTSFPWWELRPDDKLLSGQPGGDDPALYVSAARSEKGDLAVLYLPVGGEVRLKAGILTKGLQAKWFDPRTGQSTAARPTGDNTFHAPNELDWVLLLRK
jgi:Protein of unknown function (DUF4038)/Domain of unknown function (DUF5060)/Putative collagen-binding domain of a collagenase